MPLQRGLASANIPISVGRCTEIGILFSLECSKTRPIDPRSHAKGRGELLFSAKGREETRKTPFVRGETRRGAENTRGVLDFLCAAAPRFDDGGRPPALRAAAIYARKSLFKQRSTSPKKQFDCQCLRSRVAISYKVLDGDGLLQYRHNADIGIGKG